jgi:hypothetical protein
LITVSQQVLFSSLDKVAFSAVVPNYQIYSVINLKIYNSQGSASVSTQYLNGATSATPVPPMIACYSLLSILNI